MDCHPDTQKLLPWARIGLCVTCRAAGGGRAYALGAAVELGRAIQTLWRGGYERPDGTLEPLGIDEAEELVEGILVDALVAKNVKGVPERQEGGWKPPPNWRLTKAGTWSGEPGNSRFTPENPAELGLKEGETIEFRNGLPDFSPWSKGEFEVPGLNGTHKHDDPVIRKCIAEPQTHRWWGAGWNKKYSVHIMQEDIRFNWSLGSFTG